MTFTVMQDSLPMRRRFVIQGLRRCGLVAVGLMGLLVGPPGTFAPAAPVQQASGRAGSEARLSGLNREVSGSG